MKIYKVLFWLTLLGGLFIIALGFLMEYYQVESSSYVFTKTGINGGVLTPSGTKLIGCIVLFIWGLHVLSKKNHLKEKEYLETASYEFKNIKKRKKKFKK